VFTCTVSLEFNKVKLRLEVKSLLKYLNFSKCFKLL
jgi:hypothetical protein